MTDGARSAIAPGAPKTGLIAASFAPKGPPAERGRWVAPSSVPKTHGHDAEIRPPAPFLPPFLRPPCLAGSSPRSPCSPRRPSVRGHVEPRVRGCDPACGEQLRAYNSGGQSPPRGLSGNGMLPVFAASVAPSRGVWGTKHALFFPAFFQ